jgi:hypothetical protein
MDKDVATRFVGMVLGVLRAEIAEASGRTERLNDATKHSAAARETAQAVLAKVRAQRAERERRLSGAEPEAP